MVNIGRLCGCVNLAGKNVMSRQLPKGLLAPLRH
jgi:hypothetical protein